ncbi:MAG: hypothetical protein JL50_07360 [Peptococcaceae bacterium BICA1-7]|nr:MAG: hypothetical protein JL50_07360 [Peptococcaceae bacterium BICA1-7]HBV99115.1 chemotaxis protein CheW [Desulfotomaculum sp.]
MRLEAQVVIFELEGVLYAIDILQVQEIMRYMEVTPVAESDYCTEGIINLRGQVIPVVSLARRLGLPEKAPGQDTRIIVVEVCGKKSGLIVERVLEVGSYSEGELEQHTDLGVKAPFLKGVLKKEKIWLLLNLDQVA